MKGGGARSWPSDDDYTVLSLVVVVFGLGFGGWLLWQDQHGPISAVAMEVMHWEMRLIHNFTDRFDHADRQVLTAVPARVTFHQLAQLARAIGSFFLYPALVLVLGLAGLCYARAAPSRFSRDLDLDGLMREQAGTFRSTGAFLNRRLGLAGVGEGKGDPRPADPALNVGEWAARWAAGEDGNFDEDAARRELTHQLGPVWRGVDTAPPSVRCMLAAIGLHAAQRREEAIVFLGDLSKSLQDAKGEGKEGPSSPLVFPKAVVAATGRYLSEPEVTGPLLWIMRRHAYTAPAMMSALIEARRRSGVLAPSQFCFLKLADRKLWYALHSLGFPSDGPGLRQDPCPLVEAIGARDHWAAECLAKEPLFKPSIGRAISTIRAGLCDHEERIKKLEARR